MSNSQVAIVGSGIVGTTIAYLLTRKGYEVEIFEKGPDYPYPHLQQFQDQTLYLYDDPAYRLPLDLKRITLTGTYPGDPDNDRFMVVGGAATQWGGITLRMSPNDFRTRSRYGYGEDWPLTYGDLEPYYCDAEYLLGVSGSNGDNPHAPPRSRPYPLPPFELSYDDRVLAERLRQHGLLLHTVPQAKTRVPYEQRPGCLNFGTCQWCPIGARYSPNYHLALALQTGRCRVHSNTSVRRVVVGGSGQARALIYQQNDAHRELEHGAKVIIIAAGAIESARLLLLSARDRHPDGFTHGGHIGRHLMFHHLREARLHYREAFLPESVGPETAMCSQFLDPPGRGRHGGLKVKFSSDSLIAHSTAELTGLNAVHQLQQMRHWRPLVYDAESAPSPQKYVTLSEQHDRFGDPFAHVHYSASEFDHETYRFAEQVFHRFVASTGATEGAFPSAETYNSSFHHMGTCRMGLDIRDSVVDHVGRVHGTPNLFVIGGSNFASSIAVNPTLTMVALAIRAADFILRQVL